MLRRDYKEDKERMPCGPFQQKDTKAMANVSVPPAVAGGLTLNPDGSITNLQPPTTVGGTDKSPPTTITQKLPNRKYFH